MNDELEMPWKVCGLIKVCPERLKKTMNTQNTLASAEIQTEHPQDISVDSHLSYQPIR